MSKSNWIKKTLSIKECTKIFGKRGQIYLYLSANWHSFLAISLFQAELLRFWSWWIFVSLFINICVYSNTFHHHNKPNKLPQATPNIKSPTLCHPEVMDFIIFTLAKFNRFIISSASSFRTDPRWSCCDVVEVEMMSGIQFGILFVVCHPGPKKVWFLLRKPCWIYKVSYISMRGLHIQTQAGQLIAL